MESVSSNEREDLFFEAGQAATQVGTLYKKKQQIYKSIQYFLLEAWHLVISRLSLYMDHKEITEGEKFLDEIIGELDGTYCAIGQFDAAVKHFEAGLEMVTIQMGSIPPRVFNFIIQSLPGIDRSLSLPISNPALRT